MNLNLYKLQRKMPSEEINRLQDIQLKKLFDAKEAIDNGKLEQGISIIENITYNEGGIIFNGRTWPLYLAEILYKNKMYDSCWKYLNAISISHLDCLEKIRKMQAKISDHEKRPKDAFVFMIISFAYKYNHANCILSDADIDKSIKPYLKKVSIRITREELYEKIRMYIGNNIINERQIKNELVNVLE